LGWKGGIGTASRVLPESLGGYTVGALIQSNFGGILTIDGVKVGEILGNYMFREDLEQTERQEQESTKSSADEGSAMIVLATDAPLSPRNLQRLARRAALGLARAGSFMSNGSGDFVIAFSTANRYPHAWNEPVRDIRDLHNDHMSSLFLAAVESVEEAIYNSILRATTVKGFRGRTLKALPIDRVQSLFKAKSKRQPVSIPEKE